MVLFCRLFFHVKTCETEGLSSLCSSSSSQCSGGQPAGTPLFLAGTAQHPPHTRVSDRLEQRLQKPTLSSPSLSSTSLSSTSLSLTSLLSTSLSSTSVSSTSLSKDYMRLRYHQIHHLCLFHHHLLYHSHLIIFPLYHYRSCYR